jgi:ATP-binding cassette subfamily B protein
VLGLLPVAFVVATSIVVGQVPAAVTGGIGSPVWDTLVRESGSHDELVALGGL